MCAQRLLAVTIPRAVALTLLVMTVSLRADDASKDVPKPAPHPLTQVLDYAKSQHQFVVEHVRDYTCLIVKRERIDGSMQSYQYMQAKVRAARNEGEDAIPFAAYVKMLKPSRVSGREIVYVDGENDGKMLVRRRRGGITLRISLDNTQATRESTIPITDLGFDKMLANAISQIESHMRVDPDGKNSQVEMRKDAKINGRTAQVLTIMHPTRQDGLKFSRASMYFDDEWHLPTRLELYEWPETFDGEQVLTGEFTYLNLKVNVGIPDSDFRVLFVPKSTEAEE